jgi:hypothetical protein
MLEGVAHGDVVTAMAKTAAAVHNDDPLRKNHLRLELSSLWLTRGLPFEEGACALWEMVDDLEAMGVPVLGDLEGPGLDKLKKEMLFTFISSNPDYDEVVKDYYRYIGDYPEYGRFADERPRKASSPAQREKFCFDEEPRQAPNESACRATKPELGQAQREG